jgi:hypothetical protein
VKVVCHATKLSGQLRYRSTFRNGLPEISTYLAKTYKSALRLKARPDLAGSLPRNVCIGPEKPP